MLRISPTSITGTPVFESEGDPINGWTVYFNVGEDETLLVNGYLGNFNTISTLSGVYTNGDNTPFTRIFMPEPSKVTIIDVINGGAHVAEWDFTCTVCDINTPVSFFIVEKKIYMLQAFQSECRIIDLTNDKCHYYNMDYWPNAGLIILAAGSEYIIFRINETMCSFIYMEVNYFVNFDSPIKNTTTAAIAIEGADKIRITDGDNVHIVKLPFLNAPEFHYIDIPLEDI